MDDRVPLPGETLTLLGHNSGVCGCRPLIEGVDVAVLGCLRVAGENPRSLDRAVAALLRRDLLEDVTLEVTTCGSPMVVWQSCSASADGIRFSFALLGKACFVLCTLSYPGATSSVHGRCWSVPGGGRLLVVLPVTVELPRRCVVCWFALW